MKHKFDVFMWIVTFIFVGGIFFMPETIPIHWNANWVIDSYGSRYTLLILAFLPILIYYGMELAKKIDPKRQKFCSREKAYDLFRYGLSMFFVVLCGFFYYLTVFPESSPQIIVFLLLGVGMMAMGNYMPRLPQNYFMGIKTPWTLDNEYVWRKTHKVGGYSFVLSGLIISGCGLLNLSYGWMVVFIVLIIDAIFTYAYSYIIDKQVDSKKD